MPNAFLLLKGQRINILVKISTIFVVSFFLSAVSFGAEKHKSSKAKKSSLETSVKSSAKKKQRKVAEQDNTAADREKARKNAEKAKALAEIQKAKLEQQREALEKSKKQIDELNSTREKYEKEISKLQFEQKELNMEIQDAKAKTAEQKSRIQELKVQYKDMQTTRGLVVSTHKSTMAEAARWKAQAQVEEQKVKKIEDEIADLRRMIKAGQNEVERAKEENEKLIRRRSNASVDKPKLESELNRLKLQYKILKEREKFEQNKS